MLDKTNAVNKTKDETALAAELQRVKVLLRNSLIVLEEQTLMSIIGTDLEDEIGITEDEYEKYVNDKDD